MCEKTGIDKKVFSYVSYILNEWKKKKIVAIKKG